MRRFLILLLVVVLLAACGGDSDNDKDKKDQDNNGGGSESRFGSVEITGAVTETFGIEMARVDDMSADMAIFSMVLAAMENEFSQSMGVLISVPAHLAQAGTYQLSEPASVVEPDVPLVTFLDNRDGVTAYSATTGSFTLDSVGDTWSGRFEFTASTVEGQSVNASGTFSGVPVHAVSLED